MDEGQLGIGEELHVELVDTDTITINRTVLLELIARAESGDRTAFRDLEALVR
jgi:hypothetical protein